MIFKVLITLQQYLRGKGLNVDRNTTFKENVPFIFKLLMLSIINTLWLVLEIVFFFSRESLRIL